MRRTKDVEANLRYCPENHQGYGDYYTDWDTGERAVVIVGCLKVSEAGVVTLTSTLDRDVDTRGLLRNKFGIDIINTDLENLPSKMYAPGTDRVVPKNSLLGSTFLVDHETSRVLSLEPTGARRDYCAKWIRWDLEASTDTMLKTLERNKANEAAWLKEYDEDLKIGAGICALNTDYDNRVVHRDHVARLDAFMRDRSSAASPTALADVRQALAYVKTTSDWAVTFRKATGDYNTYHYLTLKPNQAQNVHLA